MPAFVKNLFAGSAKGIDSKLVLSGSAVVSSGNTIFVAFGTSNAFDAITVTDNLGNSYSSLGAGGTGNVGVRLYRADITNPGTLTTITIDQPPSFNIFAGIAVEFSGVGTLRFTGSATPGNVAVGNAYPGGNTGANSSYSAGDLWIGAWAQRSPNAFATETGGISVPAQEPTPEARTSGGSASTNVSVGLLYYLSASPQSGVGLVGRYSATGDLGAVGAAIAAKIGGPTYNDARAGTIVFTGTLVESWQRSIVYSDAPSGPLALSGSVVESSVIRTVYVDAPTGAMVFTGSAIDSYGRGYIDAATGALVLSGTKTENKVVSDARDGSLTVGGSVVESFTGPTIYSDAVSGTLLLKGSSTDSTVRPARFVQALFAGSAKNAGMPLVLSGSKVVSAGNTIFVAVGSSTASPPAPVVFDNLGNAYAEVERYAVTLVLYRADVTNSGTLTAITIDRPPNSQAYGAIAVEFSNVGVVRGIEVGQSNDGILNAYPGGDAGESGADSANYISGDLWIGAFLQRSESSFAVKAGGAVFVPALEPVVEQRTSGGTSSSNVSVGLLYYISPASRTGALVGKYAAFSAAGSVVGAAIAPRVGVVYGSIVFTGSVVESYVGRPIYSDAPAGAISLGGAVALRRTFTDARAGSLALSGTAITRRIRSDAPSGDVALNGSAVDVWFVRTIYVDKPTGSIVVAGAVAAESHVHRPQISGRLTLSGTVQERWSHVTTCAGSIRLSGAAVEKQRYADVVSGVIAVNGTVEEDYTVNFLDTCSGVLKLIGVVSETIVVVDHASGVVSLRGLASEFIIVDGQIIYDDGPTGVVALHGKLASVNTDTSSERTGKRVLVLDRSGRHVRSLEMGRVVGNLTGRLTS